MAKVANAFNRVPQSERPHIALFGRRNAGKSSLINALTGQHTSLVSEVPGTTTDPVIKSIEMQPIGPCVLIDTAGFDDSGTVGELRKQRTLEVIKQADAGIIVTDGTSLDDDAKWADLLKQSRLPHLTVVNKIDLLKDSNAQLPATVARRLGCDVVAVSALQGAGIEKLRSALASILPDNDARTLTGRLANAGDVVVLVIPQDPQAPKGRLILPQVQTLRDLMDKGCMAMCCTTKDFAPTLNALREPPHLIITDSQVFDLVERQKPPESRLTSFSILMAAHKGDIDYFVESAAAIDRLTEQSRVLIAEACTHAPLSEDIGREKIPNLLRGRAGQGLRIDIAAGRDFPDNLVDYDLVIHCGGCMFNRRFMLSRVEQCRRQGVPMTNYGITIAHLKGILNKVSLP